LPSPTRKSGPKPRPGRRSARPHLAARPCRRGRHRRLPEGTRPQAAPALQRGGRGAPAPQPLDDDVDRILSYDRITEAIAAELAAERLNLLETLAERVAERILAEPQAMRAFIRIEKLDVGPYALGVEIVRSRAEARCSNAGKRGWKAVHPLVVFLDNAAIACADLPARLDALLAEGALPLILTVGLPDLPRPVTGHKPTQRRVDLLAIEQNAWTFWPRATRAAWWWRPDRDRLGDEARQIDGLGAVQTGAGCRRWPARPASRWRWRCGWRKPWRPRRWSFTAMLQFRREAACRWKRA
jgi:hypothetical protein